MVDSLIRDVRHAIRLLLKSPAFSISAMTILGLGIGANDALRQGLGRGGRHAANGA